MHQTTLERIEQELKKIKRQLQCGTQFFDTVEEFPAVGVPCAIYVDKSTGAFYVYDTETATYISADTGEDVEFSLTTTGTSGPATLVGTILNIPQYQGVLTNPVTGTGTAGQVAYFSGTSEVTGSSSLFWDAANGRLGIGLNTGLTARAHVRGSGTTSSTTALLVQNSGATDILTVRDDGLIFLANNCGFLPTGTGASDNRLQIFGGTGGAVGTTNLITLRTNNNITSTSGFPNLVAINTGFLPTSGTATFSATIINPIINQTGGANGITRGLYVNPVLTAAADWRSIETSNNTGYAIYAGGTANNYLGGRLGIGTTTLTNATVRNDLSISGNATSYGYLSLQTILSSVTDNARIFHSEPSLQQTAFALNVLTHYFAVQSVIAGGAVLNNQYGFFAHQTLTGATNNYGFYGNIASGTGRWNLYMNGTAANYLAGNTSIGTTTESARLLVRGSGTTSATTALLVQKSDGSNIMQIRDDGVILLNEIARASATLNLYGQSGAVSGILLRSISSSETATSGTRLHVRVNETFAPTSGTCVLNTLQVDPVINQTGGANGITRGLYVNPTLTAAADWRGVEIATSTVNTVVLGKNTGSAAVEVTSTTQGFLPPRMTTAQRNLIASPAAGLVIFNTTTTKLECYDGAAWQAAW